MSDSAIDIKARKRVAELYELTDEIINASNEINETYANKIYRKYKQLLAVNKKLKKQLSQYHCPGCKCIIPSNEDVQQDRKEEEEEEEDYHNDDDNDSFIFIAENQKYQSKQKSSTSFLTTHSLIKQRRKNKNPYFISNIEDTENFDGNDSRFTKTTCDNNDNDCHQDNDDNNSDSMKDGDNEDRLFIAMDPNENETTKDDNQSEHEIQEEVDKDIDENEEEGNETTCLPVILQDIIQQKAKKNNNARSYLLNIPLYPALCEFLCDKSYTSFNRRPSGTQVRPLITNHFSEHLANDAKLRMRLCDELREIHRSYMRTFMTDPHTSRNKYISS